MVAKKWTHIAGFDRNITPMMDEIKMTLQVNFYLLFYGETMNNILFDNLALCNW